MAGGPDSGFVLPRGAVAVGVLQPDWEFLASPSGRVHVERPVPAGVNPVAARLAGAAGMPLVRFLCHAAGSALGWAGGWTALGYLLGGMVLERGGSFRNRLDWNSGGRPRCGCKECSDHARRAPSPRTARWDRRCRVGPHHESGEVSGSPARGADSGRIAPERTDAREPLAVIPERRRVQHDEAERPPVTRSTRARC